MSETVIIIGVCMNVVTLGVLVFGGGRAWGAMTAKFSGVDQKFLTITEKLQGMRDLFDERSVQSRDAFAALKDDVKEVKREMDTLRIDRERLNAIHDVMHKSHSKRLDDLEAAVDDMEIKQ